MFNKQENITKPIQIIQYKGSEPILLVPDYVATSNVDITDCTLPLHSKGIVLLTAQNSEHENGMYQYTGTSLIEYYFTFFNNTKKIYKVTQNSSYIIYNEPTDPFNQFDTIQPNDTIIVIQNNNVNLPYVWYSYDIQPNPSIKFNQEIIINNLCALNTVYDDKNHDIVLDLNRSSSYPIVLTSEVYGVKPGDTYHVVTDLIASPDIDYKNTISYTLEEGSDFTIDTSGNLILNQSLVIDGLNGLGKLKNWQILRAADPNFLNNYIFIIASGSLVKAYYYNTSSSNPYSTFIQDFIKYSFSVEPNSSNIIYEKKNFIQNNLVTITGIDSSTFINSSFYAQQIGSYEIRTRLFNNNLNLVKEDRFQFNIKQLINLPTPTPTPTPSGKKHTVTFDGGSILEINDCEECYKDFLIATVSNMSEDARYYYEFGVFAYGNNNPDNPEDTTNSDDITFTTATGVLNNGLTTEKIKTLMTTGIGKIRTTIYIKVINLENYITSTSYLTIEKCNRDFCALTPTPTTSKILKSYPPRTPTKTKTPTPTQTPTQTSTQTPTPTTPLYIPDAPTNLVAVPGNATASLSWTAPTNTIIRDYAIQYSINSGLTWITVNDGINPTTSYTVTGLTNGTSYLFRVAATNGAGTGAYTTTPSPTTPSAVPPGAPTITSVIASDQQATLSWTVPTNNGGAAITDYRLEYSSNAGTNWTVFNRSASTATTATVTGLTNGLSYIFRAAAINYIGAGSYSVNSQAVTPAAVPNAPTSLSATIINGNISLSWTAPTNTGGANITDYTIRYSINNGTSWTIFTDGVSTATSTILTGLTLSTAYIFQVAAVNRVGQGSYSNSSNSLLYIILPGSPTINSALPGDTTATLNWTTPSNGGSTITDYSIEYSFDNGSNWTIFPHSPSVANSIIVTGLTNGANYIFRIAAVNTVGAGPYSSNSSVIIPGKVPSAPSGLISTINLSTRNIELSWSSPLDNGGFAITDYIVQYSSNNGSTWTTFNDGTGVSTSVVLTGLTIGTNYIFRVAAINIRGTGNYSSSSSNLLYAFVPSVPPSILINSRADSQVNLSWTAPATNGSNIIDYSIQYSSNNGATWTSFDHLASANTSISVTGLTNGVSYIFRVAAINSVGTGAYSANSVATIPAKASDPPTLVNAAISSTNVVVSWTAPVDNGGNPVTDYIVQYSSNGGSTWTTFTDSVSTATSTTIGGLTLGLSYIFRVAAVNTIGNSIWSANSSSLTYAFVPSAPSAVLVTNSGNQQVSLSWTAPTNTGGSAVTDYIVEHSSNNGTSWITFNHPASSSTSITVTGLTNGVNYIFRVAAINITGSGPYAPVSAIGTPSTVPGVPTNVSVASFDRSSVSLSWSAPTDNGGSAITDYIIQSSSNSGTTWITYADSVNTNTNANITGLAQGLNYIFRVAAANIRGAGGYSSASSSINYTFTPAAPASITSILVNNGLQVSWTAPTSNGGSSIIDYALQLSSDDGSTWTTIDNNNTSGIVTVSSPTIVSGQTYIFRVAARNSIGLGDYIVSSARKIEESGLILSWGTNRYSELGDGFYIPKTKPDILAKKWKKIHSSKYSSSILAIDTDNKLFGWGVNNTAQLGIGNSVSPYNSPQIISEGASDNWTDIAMGPFASYGINNGKIFGWGTSTSTASNRLLGDINVSSSVPIQVIQEGLSGDWIPRESNRSWYDVASSSDGTKLVATVYNGQIYTSTDSGATWTARESIRPWFSVASSSDGSKLVAAVYNGSIYTSTDSGATWTARDNSRTWYSLASSSDGSKLVAVVRAGQIYTSTDSGATWTARDSNRQWSSVASSSDGSKLVATVDNGSIYTSTDSGATWTARESNRIWYGVASSSDGSKLVATVYGGQIYTSTDSGATWTARESNRPWQRVASSSDGSKLVATVYGGQIYTSTDSGATWTARESNRPWYGVASSSDGSKLVAGVINGQIYTSSRTEIPSSGWIKVVAGGLHTLALNNNGEVFVWGSNFYGALCGVAGSSTGTVIGPTKVPGTWIDIAAGERHSVLINSSGQMFTCGENSVGQLGNGTSGGSSISLTQIGASTTWSKVVAGAYHNLAVSNTNRLFTWGLNTSSQIGNGSTTNQLLPQQVGVSSNWDANYISAASTHSAAMNQLGQLYVWGNAAFSVSAIPSLITTIPTLTNLSTGSGPITWLIDNGKLNYAGVGGNIGMNSSTASTLTLYGADHPITNDTSKFVNIFAGAGSSLSLDKTNQSYVWGIGANNSANTNSSYPTRGSSSFGSVNIKDVSVSTIIPDGTSPATIAPAYYLAIDGSNNLYGAGTNTFNQYGTSSVTLSSSPVLTRANTVKASAGGWHSLALGTDGRIYFIGRAQDGSSGMIGNPISTTTTISSWTAIGTSTNWVEIASGELFNAAINSLGELYTWGRNNFGQLGINSITSVNIPTRVGLSSNWSKVVLGKDFAIALNSLGEIWSWGRSINGQLGIGDGTYAQIPVRIGNRTDWVKITAGNQHAFAIDTQGRLWGWGLNINGQLGNASVINSNVPVRILSPMENQTGISQHRWVSVSAGSYHSLGLISFVQS